MDIKTPKWKLPVRCCATRLLPLVRTKLNPSKNPLQRWKRWRVLKWEIRGTQGSDSTGNFYMDGCTLSGRYPRRKKKDLVAESLVTRHAGHVMQRTTNRGRVILSTKRKNPSLSVRRVFWYQVCVDVCFLARSGTWDTVKMSLDYSCAQGENLEWKLWTTFRLLGIRFWIIEWPKHPWASVISITMTCLRGAM